MSRKKTKNKSLKYFKFFGLITLILFGFIVLKTHNSDLKRIYHKFINISTKKYNSEKSAKPYLKPHIRKFEIHGIDVSKHQGKIQWDLLKHPDTTKKIDFIFIRSTYGTNKDELFYTNWVNASYNNFTLGAYHYYWANTNSTKQAEKFIETVTLKKGNLPPVLDIEKLPKFQSKSNWLKGVKNWLKIIETHYGVKPIIYTGEGFYKHHLSTDPFFKNYPRLWIANYNNIQQPSSTWHFWQYTDKVKMEGINELVDYNVFKNDAISFNKLLKK